MRNFKRMELYYDEPGEGKGNGEGAGTGGNEPTLDDLKAKIENFEKIQAEKDKEINSLKSQLGHSNKQLEEFQKNGKTAEELANLEKEKIEKELKLKVTVSDDAIHAVVNGISKVLDDFSRYKNIIISPSVEY